MHQNLILKADFPREAQKEVSECSVNCLHFHSFTQDWVCFFLLQIISFVKTCLKKKWLSHLRNGGLCCLNKQTFKRYTWGRKNLSTTYPAIDSNLTVFMHKPDFGLQIGNSVKTPATEANQTKKSGGNRTNRAQLENISMLLYNSMVHSCFGHCVVSSTLPFFQERK